ncbi:hypothetical protein QE450_001419 [Paenibacillus sp. SORGH_AS306]|nr:hypothetical protein [Paenibacillus sp. SORGH_AS_0306]MDR6110966.1 hypothetical protein [Paenibacillus sp. SORGH_AS_0338]
MNNLISDFDQFISLRMENIACQELNNVCVFLNN